MDEKSQIEKIATDVFNRMRLKWVIASVEQNRLSHAWNIEVQSPDGSELILSVPNGSMKEIKESIRQQTEEELDRIEAHHR
jgi:hypothetical protein